MENISIISQLPIEAAVRQAIPEEESDDDKPLSKLVKQKEPVWKWRKHFVETPLQKCSLSKGVVNIQLENATLPDEFTKCIALPGLLSKMKTESERYAVQNGTEFKISEELCAFLGVNILMGINKLPTIKIYWSVDKGLGNPLIQKAMTRGRFLKILQNIHFADNHKELPKDSDEHMIAPGN